jgi:hypothetical protein
VRQFASPGFKIWNLGREAKVLYTIFCVFALAAYAVSVLYAEDLIGLRTRDSRLYYAGGAIESAAPPDDKRIQLPEEAAHPTREPISYRHLLEVTHFHLFTVPVFLLIVAHLFMLTGLSAGAKLGWILACGLGSLVHVAAPWIVRYAGGAFLMPSSGAVMLGAFAFMTVYSVYAMWRGGPPEPARPPSDNSRP